jgi:hypothetical protein
MWKLFINMRSKLQRLLSFDSNGLESKNFLSKNFMTSFS